MAGLTFLVENVAAAFAYSCACASKNVGTRVLTAFTGAVVLGAESVRSLQEESSSLAAHTLHSYWPRSPLRLAPCYCPHIPNPAYHWWWGWYYYVQAFDHPSEQLYEHSLAAFDQFAKQSADLMPQGGKGGLNEAEYLRIHKLDRLFPLTQLALCGKEDGAVRALNTALIECSGDMMDAIASITAEDEHLSIMQSDANAIVCRYFAHVFNMCYAAKAQFTPGAQPRRDISEHACYKRNQLVADKLYALSVKWNYTAAVRKVWPEKSDHARGPDSVAGFLPVEWWFSRWLRRHLPGSTNVIAIATVALGVLYASTTPTASWWIKWPFHHLHVPPYFLELILTDLALCALIAGYVIFALASTVYALRSHRQSTIASSRKPRKRPNSRV